MICPYCEKVYRPDDHPGAHEVDCAAETLLFGFDDPDWIPKKVVAASQHMMNVLLTEADGLDDEMHTTEHTDAINAVIARVYSNNEEPRE